jgi:CBS domain containing-hemolysin-like protein
VSWLEIPALLLLAGLSVFLSSLEASFHLLTRRRLAQVTHHQEALAELASSYLEDPPRLLMPVHLGTYTAHVGMTVLITSLLFDLAAQWAMVAAFATMMAYLLLFRVSVPYITVRRDPERTFLRLLPAFDLYARGVGPVVGLLRRRAAPDPDEEDEAGAPPMPEVPPPPVQEADEHRLAEALGRFSETAVREVMTPRPDVTAIAASAPVTELRRVMRETKYSRVPVYGDNLDDIHGIVDVRDLLDHEEAATVGELSRSAQLVPETKHIADLLREMQAERFTFAVVIDEYGAMAGVVSVEDIVEELVGEIQDEFDVEELDPLSIEDDGAILVDCRVGVDRLEEALEAELSVEEGIETVGGLVTSIFGRIPRTGEQTRYRGFEVEVLDAEEKRVNRVRFRRIPVPDPA